MKTYYNGPRQGMMYGGGAMMRKPMMYGGTATPKKMNMGGLADENRKSTAGQAGTMNPMGSMTEKKKFSMGMMAGGMAKKKPSMAGYALGGKASSKKKTKDFGLLSVKAGVDNNPDATKADRIVGATKKV